MEHYLLVMGMIAQHITPVSCPLTEDIVVVEATVVMKYHEIMIVPAHFVARKAPNPFKPAWNTNC